MATDEPRAQELASNIKAGVGGRLRDIWWAVLLRGVLALVLAACAMFWPEKTVDILVKVLGVYFLIDGIWAAYTAWHSRDTTIPVQAAVSLVLGLLLLFWTGIGVTLFMILVGAWAVLQGIGVIMSSRDLEAHDEDRMLMAVIGGLIAVVGVVFIAWPKESIEFVSWLIGIGATVVGLALVYLAMRLKRVEKQVESLGPDE